LVWHLGRSFTLLLLLLLLLLLHFCLGYGNTIQLRESDDLVTVTSFYNASDARGPFAVDVVRWRLPSARGG